MNNARLSGLTLVKTSCKIVEKPSKSVENPFLIHNLMPFFVVSLKYEVGKK